MPLSVHFKPHRFEVNLIAESNGDGMPWEDEGDGNINYSCTYANATEKEICMQGVFNAYIYNLSVGRCSAAVAGGGAVTLLEYDCPD